MSWTTPAALCNVLRERDDDKRGKVHANLQPHTEYGRCRLYLAETIRSPLEGREEEAGELSGPRMPLLNSSLRRVHLQLTRLGTRQNQQALRQCSKACAMDAKAAEPPAVSGNALRRPCPATHDISARPLRILYRKEISPLPRSW